MTSQAIARVNPTIASVFENPAAWSVLKDVAVVMFSGGGALGVLPSCFKSPQQVQAGMLVLMGMGEDPVGGLQHVHPLPGNKIGFDYKFLMGLVEARAPQWRYEVEEHDATHIKGWFRASDTHPVYHLSFHIDEAKQAGLVRGGSAWVNHPADMLFKSWWLRGARRTAPAALRGVGVQYDSESQDEESTVVVVERKPLGEIVDKGFSEAKVLGEGAEVRAENSREDAPGAGSEAPKPVDWKAKFVERAKLAKFDLRSKAKIKTLIEELLTVGGVKPTINSSDDIPSADWHIAFNELCKRYDESGTYVEGWNKKGAGNGGEPHVDAGHTDVPPSPVEDDAPPATDEPDDSQGELDGAAAREAQMQDREYLAEVARSLELAYKQPESVLKEAPKGSGKKWFVNRDILLRCGFSGAAGAAQSKALFPSTNPEYNLEPRDVYALCTVVLEELDKVAAKGRPVSPQR